MWTNLNEFECSSMSKLKKKKGLTELLALFYMYVNVKQEMKVTVVILHFSLYLLFSTGKSQEWGTR